MYFLSFIWMKCFPNLSMLTPCCDISFVVPLALAPQFCLTLPFPPSGPSRSAPFLLPTDSFTYVYLLPLWNWVSWGQVLYLIWIWSPWHTKDAPQIQVYICIHSSHSSHILPGLLPLCVRITFLLRVAELQSAPHQWVLFMNALYTASIYWVVGSFSYQFLLMGIAYFSYLTFEDVVRLLRCATLSSLK